MEGSPPHLFLIAFVHRAVQGHGGDQDKDVVLLAGIGQPDPAGIIGEIVSSPVYSVGDNDTVSNYIVMPVEYDDFILAASAYQGAAKMQLRDLISFAPRAELFGYSSEIYSAILINRLFAPLQILILFILLASVAWNYQLRGTSVFKLYYLFAFPLFTFVVYTADEFLRYLCVQFNLVCIGRLGIDLSFIVVGMLNVLLLFAASILFVSRKRSDC